MIGVALCQFKFGGLSFDGDVLALFQDSINIAHPKFHADVALDPSKFLESDPKLKPWLHKLRDSDKRMFLITNRY